jgi:hypothetical protein
MIYWHIAPFAAANQERQRGSPQMALCQEDAKASCRTRDEVGPSESPCRGEASNSHKLLRSKAAVVNVMVKGVAVIMRDERKQTSADASKAN